MQKRESRFPSQSIGAQTKKNARDKADNGREWNHIGARTDPVPIGLRKVEFSRRGDESGYSIAEPWHDQGRGAGQVKPWPAK